MLVIARDWETGELQQRDVDPAQPCTRKINGERYWLTTDQVAASQAEWQIGADAAAAERVREGNETAIRAAHQAEIASVLAEADALDALVADWSTRAPSSAEVLAHVKTLTRNQARIGRDFVRLVRLELRRLEQA